MKTFVFDLDETLMTARPDYEKAKWRFANWLYENWGEQCPPLKVVVDTHQQWDRRLAREMGYVKERFPKSFQSALKELAERAGKQVSERDLQQVYEFGMIAYGDAEHYAERGFMPGAKQALDFLHEQGENLVLLTQGDPDVQWPKIEGLKLEQWFGEDIHVVWEKEAEHLRSVIDCRPELAWLVEDKKETIRTALAIGMGGIHVPAVGTFEHREEQDFEATDRFYELGSLEDFAGIYPRL